jgi:hypothetical protein
MTDRQKLAGLTLFQILLILLGFAAFLGVKITYQKYFLVSSFKDDLKASIRENRKFRSQKFVVAGALFPLILVAGRNAASLFYRAGRRKRQIKRDMKATILLNRLQAGHHEAFTLYLRSFAEEEKMSRKKGLGWFLFFEGDIYLLDRESIELMISAEVNADFPMIAMGRPGEKLGAGRLPAVDADWEALILFLMERATLIVTIPSTSKGVIWEMEILSGRYPEKSIYVMPPKKYYARSAVSAEQHWQSTREALLFRGIFLPEYSKRGALFMLGSDNRVAHSCDFEKRFGGTRLNELLSLRNA